METGNKNIKQLAGYLKKNPNDSFTKFALALELLKLGDVSKARVLFESVLKQDPDYLGVYFHLGKLYENNRRPNDAEELYKKGIELAKKQNNERTRQELTEALEHLKTELDND